MSNPIFKLPKNDSMTARMRVRAASGPGYLGLTGYTVTLTFKVNTTDIDPVLTITGSVSSSPDDTIASAFVPDDTLATVQTLQGSLRAENTTTHDAHTATFVLIVTDHA